VLVDISARQNFIERWSAFRASIKKTQAEQDGAANGGQLSCLNSDFHFQSEWPKYSIKI
jgi:hypothetical protein